MHVPLQAPAECTAQYEHTITDLDRRTVAGMVSCMDAGECDTPNNTLHNTDDLFAIID